MSLKVAIIGVGYIGKIHAQAIHNTTGLVLNAAVNNQPDLLNTFCSEFKVPYQYDSVDALLKSGNLDMAVIGIPNYLHAPFANAILKAGIPVMVEKPMAMNLPEAEEMMETSQKRNVPLMIAHCWRFDEEVRWLKQQVEMGKIGKIIRSKGYGVHVNWGPQGWFTQKQYAGGGALIDMGIHAIDTSRFLVGDPQPVSVYAVINTSYKDCDVDDTGVILINWDNGVTSYIESGWWQPHADGLEASTQLYGTQGFGQVLPTKLELPVAVDQPSEVFDPGFVYPRKDHCLQEMYDAQMAHFAECIREDKTPVPGGMEGLINMKIVDAAYRSAVSGEVVKL